MVIYFLKSTFLLLVFCLIFKWNLENKKSLQFIRFYLLASIVFALVVPLINFQFLVRQSTIVGTKEYIFNQLPDLPLLINSTIPEQNISIVLMVYVFICAVFLIRFLYNLIKILQLNKSGAKVETSFGNLIVSSKVNAPFTFYNWIYVNKAEWENNTINSAILYHEQTHVKQKHSVDILFLEVLKIVLWFQPLLYYFKRIIQENHEYLADEFSLQQTNNLKNYQELILNYYGTNQTIVALSSSIHFNNLKKRFIMMKITKKGKVWETIFYTLTVALTYVGFVGIEAKAADIKNVETKVSNIIEQSVKQPEKISFIEPFKKEEINKVKIDSIILTYIKGEKSAGYFNHNDLVYYYIVEEDLKVSIYNRYGVVQNEKDFTYKLKAVTKAEKEKGISYAEISIDKEGVAFENEEPLKFVEKKAQPSEGLQRFFNEFIRKFNVPENPPVNSNNEIKIILKFIVEKNGSISEIKGNSEMDSKALVNEAIRVLNTMPNWSPAEHEGEVVRSTFTMPITIRLNPAEVENKDK